MKNYKGFTLIELLATIIIVALLLAIAVPTISKYIDQSKRKVYIATARQYVDAAQKKVAHLDFSFFDSDTTYYVHINNIELNNNKQSPYAIWKDAYVAIIYDGISHYYYWISADESGHRINLTREKILKEKDIYVSKNLDVNNRAPIGNRKKIYLLDDNGVVQSLTPFVLLSKEEARSCYSYDEKPDASIRLTYYNKDCGVDVVIPGMIDDKIVSEIYQYTYRGMNLNSVIIPDTVTHIGTRSFSYNNISSLEIPSSVVTIGSGAFLQNKISELKMNEGLVTIGTLSFSNNQISDLSIPKSVTTIGSCAFCSNPLTNPSFLFAKSGNATDYSTITGYIGDFSEFAQDKKFIIPAVTNGVPLQRIAASAFSSMGLTDWEVVIPNTVRVIEASAFNASSIGKINLPHGLTTIGSLAFYNNRLRSLNIPSTVTSIGSTAFNLNLVANPEEAFVYRRTTNGIDYSTIISYAGANRKNLVIPEAKSGVILKNLMGGSFNYLSLTGTLRIPPTVTSIPALTFQLNYLSSIDNGDGDTSRGSFVFKRMADGSIDYSTIVGYGNSSVAVVVPNYVKHIGSHSFNYSLIRSVNLPEGLITIGSNAFNKCRLTGTIVIPSTVTTIGDGAFLKVRTYADYNLYDKIINKTGRAFNWSNISGNYGAASGNIVTGTVENWYGNIEVSDK